MSQNEGQTSEIQKTEAYKDETIKLLTEEIQLMMKERDELQRKLATAEHNYKMLGEERDAALERVKNLEFQLETFKAGYVSMREALQKIAEADCPKYMAHPQSVWWQIHVVEGIARKALEGQAIQKPKLYFSDSCTFCENNKKALEGT